MSYNTCGLCWHWTSLDDSKFVRYGLCAKTSSEVLEVETCRAWAARNSTAIEKLFQDLPPAPGMSRLRASWAWSEDAACAADILALEVE